MPDFVTDTHGLIWYLEDSPRLGAAARAAFAGGDRGESVIYVPTICLVEIIYLQEKGRIPANLKAHLDTELQNGSSGLLLVGLTAEIANAVARIQREQVPELPDRVIAATALHLKLPLISRDRKIQMSGTETVW